MNYTEQTSIGSLTELTEEENKLLTKVMTWLKQTEGADSEANWLIAAEECYDFYAGDQDSSEVLQKLAAAKRPALVYNEVKPKVDVVVGLAGQNRQLPSAFPVERTDEAITEKANNVIKFFRRDSKFADNELVCFEHTVKSGRSLLHFYVDDENPFEPNIKTRFIHGRNFKIDPRSIEYDLSDARFIFLDFWYDKEEIQTKYPNFDPEKVTQLQSSDGSSPLFYNAVEGTYRITECWYKEAAEVYWVINPVTKQSEKLDKISYERMKKAMAEGFTLPSGQVIYDENFIGIKRWGTVHKFVIFSNCFIFESGKSKHRWEGYPDVLFGAFKHDKENRWFGLIDMMLDPQKGVNTMRRQMQHLLQTAPKGILLHEVGAILDIESYEKKSAEPNYHMEVASGALAKVKFTDQPTISPVYGQLMGEDKQFMKDVSGIQNDTLGIQTYSREPGITTQLRQGQNIAILFILLDNFKKSRLLATRILFSFIQQYVTQERVIRIEGQEGERLMQINSQNDPTAPDFNDITVGRYDFYVEEGIETVNSRNSLAQMLVDISHNNPGAVPPDLIIEYSGAPFTVVQKLKQYAAQNQQAAQQAEQEKAAREQEMETARLNNQKYIAIINNLTKIALSEKQIEGSLVQTMLAGLQQKEARKQLSNKGEENVGINDGRSE
jgi:hypothetical protein